MNTCCSPAYSSTYHDGQPVGVGAASVEPPQWRPKTRSWRVIASYTGHQLRDP